MYQFILSLFSMIGIRTYVMMGAIIIPVFICSTIVAFLSKSSVTKFITVIISIFSFVAGLSIMLHIYGINI